MAEPCTVIKDQEQKSPAQYLYLITWNKMLHFSLHLLLEQTTQFMLCCTNAQCNSM